MRPVACVRMEIMDRLLQVYRGELLWTLPILPTRFGTDVLHPTPPGVKPPVKTG
jgi:hypothetical protein